MPFHFSPFPQLLTEHLFLRHLIGKDDEQVFALRSDDTVNRFLDRPRAQSIEEARDFIKKINSGITADQWIFWAICFREELRLIGTICLWNFSEENRQAEIGYELLPDFHHKGIMQEAMGKVMEFGFSTLGLNRIEAWTVKQNIPSIKILEHNHFARDFKAESAINHAVEGPDRVVYSLDSATYSARAGH